MLLAIQARRLCWLNTDSKHICSLAILGRNDHLPWRAAKICFQNQRDFNYIDANLDVSAEGQKYLLDARTGARRPLGSTDSLHLARHEMKVLVVG